MSNVVEIARSYIGKVKYVFGAKDPDNGRSDCSGFTHRVFERAGYKIGGYTEAVWTDSSLENVSKNNLRAGDLILFKNTYDSGYKDGVSHIGIYSGNGMFIHCGSAGVVEEKLNTPFWNQYYLGAKRVSGASSGKADNVIYTGNNLKDGVDFKLWGDLVVVFISTLLIIAGVVSLVLGVKSSVQEII